MKSYPNTEKAIKSFNKIHGSYKSSQILATQGASKFMCDPSYGNLPGNSMKMGSKRKTK